MRKLLSPILILYLCTIQIHASAQVQPNIIFIICDDLNDWVEGFGGHPQTITPNIYALEQLGTTFLNANTASTLCAPSRTSMMLGKSVNYHGVVINDIECDSFRGNFADDLPIVTLPQYLKDAGNYFTMSIDKIYHCPDEGNDFDFYTSDPCAKQLSWNKFIITDKLDTIQQIGQAKSEGVEQFKWAKIDSEFTSGFSDYIAADSMISFIQAYAVAPENFCNKPFFACLGIHVPHSNLYIPEQYFLDYYVDDFYQTPFIVPYNHPADTFPYNGLVMPPQPLPWWSDITSLGALANMQVSKATHNEMLLWPNDLTPVPEIDPGLTDAERDSILSESKRANGVMAYLAAIRFGDDMIGRVMDELEMHPDIYNNTIIIFTSDHGFSMGEKKHWGKSNLWETDVRVPFIIADLRNINQQVSTKSIGLLDLFPTLCEYAGIDPPLNPDGTQYLDGKNLLPLMSDPAQYWERPVNTQISNAMDGELCFTQNSIRTNRFHYIRYASNAGVGETGCNLATSYPEEELYEIGENYETDPNEWNNLAADENYRPLMDFLCNWLPDSANFNERVYTTIISDGSDLCSVQYTDTLLLSAQLFDTTGIFIPAPEPEHLFKWTNNLTADELFGATIQFPLSLIDEADFDLNNKILFYLSVYNNASGKYEAFGMQDIYLHQYEVPTSYFTVSVADTFTISIDDYFTTGTYDSSWWDMGNGYSTGIFPDHYDYGAEGTFTITNYMSYNAGDTSCIISFSQTIIIDTIEQPDTIEESINIIEENIPTLYPNPAINEITLISNQISSAIQIDIYNEIGQLVYSEELSKIETHQINTSKFPAGNYVLRFMADENMYHLRFEVVH